MQNYICNMLQRFYLLTPDEDAREVYAEDLRKSAEIIKNTGIVLDPSRIFFLKLNDKLKYIMAGCVFTAEQDAHFKEIYNSIRDTPDIEHIYVHKEFLRLLTGMLEMTEDSYVRISIRKKHSKVAVFSTESFVYVLSGMFDTDIDTSKFMRL